MPIDDSGKLVTLQWPKCLRANRVTTIGLPRPLVHIGETSVGVESRQLVSRTPRGAYIEAEFKWVAEGDDHIEEFYDFWFDSAVGPWNVFLIDKSNSYPMKYLANVVLSALYLASAPR